MVAPGGRQCWRGPLCLPLPLQRIPISAGRRLGLERGKQIRSPNKSETEVSTRRGFRSELYPNPSSRQTGTQTKSLQSNLHVLACGRKPRCHVAGPLCFSKATPPALLKQDAAGVLATLGGLRSVPCFRCGSRSGNRDEAVDSLPTRTLSERWLIVLEVSSLRPWILV